MKNTMNFTLLINVKFSLWFQLKLWMFFFFCQFFCKLKLNIKSEATIILLVTNLKFFNFYLTKSHYCPKSVQLTLWKRMSQTCTERSITIMCVFRVRFQFDKKCLWTLENCFPNVIIHFWFSKKKSKAESLRLRQTKNGRQQQQQQ